jgi:periodic tryptophan protein 1
MNAVTCLTWIKRGVAKEHPDTVKLTDEELSALLQSSGKLKSNDSDDEGDDKEDSQGTSSNPTVENDNGMDTLETKYNLDHYDDDDDDDDVENGALSMAGLSFYDSNQQDPYLKKEEKDSDDDSDETIRPDDNLIALGKVHEDYFTLEVWVSNSSDGSLYCHHDTVLSNCPLAIEWVGFDSGDENPLSGNLVAIGSMAPDIELWDIDVVNTLEPAFVLKGEHKKKKKHNVGSKKMKRSPGHRDAVLGLSWNQNRQSVLASASADESVGVWDLTSGVGVSFFRSHGDKVQTVQWHPVEDQLLLSGCYDGCVRLFDCRTSPGDPVKSWSLGGEIEKVAVILLITVLHFTIF